MKQEQFIRYQEEAKGKMIWIKDLNKSFGDLHVLKDFCLEVARGEVVAIIGPSGSGKTTLLRCVNHLVIPDSGEVWVGGKLIGKKRVDGRFVEEKEREILRDRAEIGIVFQLFNLFPHMTVLQNIIEAPMAVRGLRREEAEALARDLLRKVDLLDKIDAYPGQLSGGQQQRVAIARSLAMQPKVMLFDEVTSALDPELIDEVLNVMKQLAEEGMTMLIVTHEMEFGRDVADRIVFMDEGRLVEQGDPHHMLTNPQHERTREFLRRILSK